MVLFMCHRKDWLTAGFKSIAIPPSDPVPPRPSVNPPPRPPRRIALEGFQSGSHIPPTHAPSHSLSSLAMFSPPNPTISLDSPTQTSGAGVSRTQSLRAQAKHIDVSGLGRSSSMRAAGEVSEDR